MLKYGANLLARDTRKPLDKLIDLGTIFEVLEQGSDRYPCSREHPRTTDACRVALYGRT